MLSKGKETKRSEAIFGPLFKQYFQLKGKSYEKYVPDVWIKVKINRIANFDPIRMFVDVDFVLVLDWIDPSVADIDENLYDERNHFSPVSHFPI